MNLIKGVRIDITATKVRKQDVARSCTSYHWLTFVPNHYLPSKLSTTLILGKSTLQDFTSYQYFSRLFLYLPSVFFKTGIKSCRFYWYILVLYSALMVSNDQLHRLPMLAQCMIYILFPCFIYMEVILVPIPLLSS